MMRILIIILITLPGIVEIIHLHPYEYVYYNTLAGGEKGAFRNYEMDYWYTSLREDVEFLNQISPPGSKIILWGGLYSANTYLRDDLIIHSEDGHSNQYGGEYQYAILSSRFDHDVVFPDVEPIFIVQRNGAVFSVVKQLSETSKP